MLDVHRLGQAPAARRPRAASRRTCWRARSARPPGRRSPTASAAVAAGSRGSARHDDPGPVRVSPRLPGSRTATPPPARTTPIAARRPRRPAAPTRPIRLPGTRPRTGWPSGPTRPAAAPRRRCRSRSCRARRRPGRPGPGTAGPAACQLPPCSVKIPAVPGRLQSPASIGTPAGPNAAAVKPGQPAGLARGGARHRPHAGQPGPPGPGARAQLGGPAAGQGDEPSAGAGGQRVRRLGQAGGDRACRDQLVPSSLVAASGENVRS